MTPYRDPTAGAAKRNVETATLTDALVLEGANGTVRVRLDRTTARLLFGLLNINTDRDGDPYAVRLKETAPELLHQLQGHKSEIQEGN